MPDVESNKDTPATVTHGALTIADVRLARDGYTVIAAPAWSYSDDGGPRGFVDEREAATHTSSLGAAAPCVATSRRPRLTRASWCTGRRALPTVRASGFEVHRSRRRRVMSGMSGWFGATAG